MSRRKTFVKESLPSRTVERRSVHGHSGPRLALDRPATTRVEFPPGTPHHRSFDFAPWYGAGVDSVTLACQLQIERFLSGLDSEVEAATIAAYCHIGIRSFLEFAVLYAAAIRRELSAVDINRELVDGYISFLASSSTSPVTQRGKYQHTKAVLKALCRRGVIHEVHSGDHATFPGNPFPGVHRKVKGESPLSPAERKAFTLAVRAAVRPIFKDGVEVTSDLLAYAVLAIALHTGRNTTPLLEIGPDCLRPHPKEGTLFLVLFKRRGHSTSKVAVRAAASRDFDVELMPTLRPSVSQLVYRLIDLSAPLRAQAKDTLKDRILLYRMRTPGRRVGAKGQIQALSADQLARGIRSLVRQFGLVDRDGKPLRVNVSRLRKTFVNRIFELLDGDVVATAAAAGSSQRVTAEDYLRPGADAEKNWRFLGTALVSELLTATIGASERTPLGRCSDAVRGEFAPKDGSKCMNFFSCLRCRNYVVTGDDLHRLFSFYWRVFRERANMSPAAWRRQFAHIPRLIERDVIEWGISAGIFKREAVDRERERARHNPEPFWASDIAMRSVMELSNA